MSMKRLTRVRDIPLPIAHLAIGHGLRGHGAGPARLVWRALWSRVGDGLVVTVSDTELAAAVGTVQRQVQSALSALDRCGLIQRSGTPIRGREIMLRPRIAPVARSAVALPPVDALSDVCSRVRERPHVDVAVTVGLLAIAQARNLVRAGEAYSDPFTVTASCIADLLGLSRNMPRRSIDSLVCSDIVRGDHTTGLQVALPVRWTELSTGVDPTPKPQRARRQPVASTCEASSRAATVISAKEAAALIGIHHVSLYAAARRGEVPCRMIGSRFIFVRETLIEWLMGRGTR